MPGPKNKELGIRSSKSFRGGIDFENWEGINRQNDPGAIRDTQLYNGTNVRLSGNEIQCRGGLSPIHTTPLTGSVFGFIEAQSGSSILLVNDSFASAPDGSKLSRYYSGATPVFNTVFPYSANLQGITSTADAIPRRALIRYGEGVYQFGLNGAIPTLFRIILPPFDTPVTSVIVTQTFARQSKLVPIVSIPEFASAVQRTQRSSDTAVGPVLYIGSMTTGNVYLWDGTTLTTEDSNLANERHIMAVYKEDVYAIAGNTMRQRNGGLWNISTTVFAGAFVPTAAFQYKDILFIVGKVGALGKVFSWNGTTITNHTATIDALLGTTDYTPTDVNVFNSLAHILIRVDSAGTLAIVQYNNSSFALGPVDTNIAEVGCLEPNGDKLFFTSSYTAPEVGITASLFYTESGSSFTLATGTASTLVPDMVAF